MRKVIRDYLTSGLVFLISSLYLVFTLRIRSAPIGNPHTPKVFPLILASFGIILAAILYGKTRMYMRRNKQSLQDDAYSPEEKIEIKQLLYLALVASIMGVGYTIFFHILGYPIATTIFIMGYMFFINGRKRWKQNIIVPIVFSVLVYVLFARILFVQLPLWPRFF